MGVQVGLQQLTQHIGPLPPPEMLQGYNLINGTFAERIMKMAEDDGRHVRRADARAQWMLFIENVGSRVIALLFAAGLLYAAYLLALQGHDWLAGTMVAALIGGITALVWRGSPKRGE